MQLFRVIRYCGIPLARDFQRSNPKNCMAVLHGSGKENFSNLCASASKTGVFWAKQTQSHSQGKDSMEKLVVVDPVKVIMANFNLLQNPALQHYGGNLLESLEKFSGSKSFHHIFVRTFPCTRLSAELTMHQKAATFQNFSAEHHKASYDGSCYWRISGKFQWVRI